MAFSQRLCTTGSIPIERIASRYRAEMGRSCHSPPETPQIARRDQARVEKSSDCCSGGDPSLSTKWIQYVAEEPSCYAAVFCGSAQSTTTSMVSFTEVIG